MKAIKLSHGKEAIVDDEDFGWLSNWKWSYLHNGYACRKTQTSRAGGIKREAKIRYFGEFGRTNL
jgi:hypothetical protein